MKLYPSGLVIGPTRAAVVPELIAQQSKSQRGLLVRLCEDSRRRLLEDLIPNQPGGVLGHIRVGDASFGGLRDIGDGRCNVGSYLKATESRSDGAGNLIDGIQIAVDLTLRR